MTHFNQLARCITIRPLHYCLHKFLCIRFANFGSIRCRKRMLPASVWDGRASKRNVISIQGWAHRAIGPCLQPFREKGMAEALERISLQEIQQLLKSKVCHLSESIKGDDKHSDIAGAIADGNHGCRWVVEILAWIRPWYVVEMVHYQRLLCNHKTRCVSPCRERGCSFNEKATLRISGIWHVRPCALLLLMRSLSNFFLAWEGGNVVEDDNRARMCTRGKFQAHYA